MSDEPQADEVLGIDEHYGIITPTTQPETSDPNEVLAAFRRGGIAPTLKQPEPLSTDYSAPVTVVGGEVSISRQLLEQSNLTATDLDGKTATFDERLADELAAAYLPDYVSKYRWPEYVPPVVVPPTRRQLLRKWIADRLRSVAGRIAQSESEDEWEDD